MECEKFLKEMGFKEFGDSSKIIAEIISKDIGFILVGDSVKESRSKPIRGALI